MYTFSLVEVLVSQISVKCAQSATKLQNSPKEMHSLPSPSRERNSSSNFSWRPRAVRLVSASCISASLAALASVSSKGTLFFFFFWGGGGGGGGVGCGYFTKGTLNQKKGQKATTYGSQVLEEDGGHDPRGGKHDDRDVAEKRKGEPGADFLDHGSDPADPSYSSWLG